MMFEHSTRSVKKHPNKIPKSTDKWDVWGVDVCSSCNHKIANKTRLKCLETVSPDRTNSLCIIQSYKDRLQDYK